MNLFGSKSEDIFGLDIGYETIKLVQIFRKKNNIYLEGAVEIPLTERILEKDHFKNKAKTATLIKEACKKARPSGIRAKRIVSALPETFVFSKTIQMPKMSKEEYEKAIPTEAAQYIPIPVDQVYLDYQIMIIHPDEPLVDLLLVAAPKKLVDEYVEVTKMAGYELAALETKPIAVGRAISFSAPLKGAVIIEIGTELTRLSLWDQNNIRLITSIPVGKNQLEGSLQHEHNPQISVTESIGTSSILSALSEEILNSIKYHQSRDYRPAPITKIYICGSGALIKGVKEYISKTTNVVTELVSPNLSGNDKLGTEYVTAYGLALRNDFE